MKRTLTSVMKFLTNMRLRTAMLPLPGVRLYRECGYTGGRRIQHPVCDGLTIDFVKMSKG